MNGRNDRTLLATLPAPVRRLGGLGLLSMTMGLAGLLAFFGSVFGLFHGFYVWVASFI